MFGPHLVKVCCMTKSSNKGHMFVPYLFEVCSETKSSNEGRNLDHIWSKSTVRQSPLTRGTFWTTFGQSPLHDKVLQYGAHFGPHLVKVCSETKSSNKGHILDHSWSKSSVWQSPPTRGTIWTTFGQSLLRDKVLQQGAQFGPHLVKVRSETKSSNKGHQFLKHLVNVHRVASSSDDQSWASFSGHIWPKSACDTSSNEGHFSFLCHIWPTSAAWYATLISHPSYSQHYLHGLFP